MKTKILVECPALISSVKIGVLSVLENRKECEVKFKRTIEINEKDIVWSDIVISVRGCERASLKIVKAANKAKRFTIMFLDDDLINIPLDLDSTKYYNDRELKKYIEKVLENSNVLWAVNPRIIKKYSKFTIEKKGILSKVPMEIENDIERVEFSTNPLKILYAGSIDHEKTLKKIIIPVVKKFNDEISSGKVSFTFIGANPHIKNTKHYKYFESYEKYKKFVKEGRFSIGLAPIEITEFYKSKYYNKFLEYSSIGVLGIYTNSEPYKLVVRHNENGILCKNEVESWYSEIKKVIDNPNKIRNMIKKAQEDLVKNYNLNIVQNELFKQIPELLTYKAPLVELKSIKLKDLKYVFYMERLKLLMRIYGLKSIYVIPYRVLKKIVKKIVKILGKEI